MQTLKSNNSYCALCRLTKLSLKLRNENLYR